MVEAIATGTRLRRNLRIVTCDRAEEGSCNFGKGEKSTIQVSWGDVATAFHSTGIPNIGPFPGVTSDQGVCAYALVRQVVPWAGLHAKPPQVPG
jgi:short subunit dehydrogenase-like uncharacterized protein